MTGTLRLPHTPFSLRAEHLLNTASAAMARAWPLLVALIYLDCLAGILLGRIAHDLTQILWHLVAIALSHVLATLGCRIDGRISLHAFPHSARARKEIVICWMSLTVLIGLLAAACASTSAHPLPLQWLVRSLVCAISLVLALAAASRIGRLRAGLKHALYAASCPAK
ncbi:MAG: hypothetical protein KF853_15770 [Rhodocyclaceae bacterium]|nr:hypothetical protein [Rhodocyclaceae bacterium]MCP5296042.1 hypothetical protein [Zoogloeaceae bacterium]PKO89968.1 MAG: hypothetical protein CVU18_02360 [Betaproteobacteria bacterium HGW-Betaproteobacteria-12]MBX3678472.1 hypothetical protein [Rhodocyclaceae bacterium]MCB1892436.1 hypothetical protein [Rhodocyclaceae bacterium]